MEKCNCFWSKTTQSCQDRNKLSYFKSNDTIVNWECELDPHKMILYWSLCGGFCLLALLFPLLLIFICCIKLPSNHETFDMR